MSILSDPVVYRYSGLSFHHAQQRIGLDVRTTAERSFPAGFPTGCIVSPLYVTYPNFSVMPKRGSYRAFFVLRDPRDLVVSWYFSARDNHIVDPDPRNPLVEARRDLRSISSIDEGLDYATTYWTNRGRFASLRSWYEYAQDDDDVALFRYEDLTGPGASVHFRNLFDHLTIDVPEQELERLLTAYSFRRLSGRAAGESNERSHLRHGRGGDWRNHFSKESCEKFRTQIGDLVRVLGYSWDS